MRWMVLGLGLMAGCATVPYDPEPTKTPEEFFSERWAGRTDADVLLVFGPPNDILKLNNGNHIKSYHAERQVSSSSSRGFIWNANGGARAQSLATTVYCDRRFEIDRTGRVARALIAGSDCDFGR